MTTAENRQPAARTARKSPRRWPMVLLLLVILGGGTAAGGWYLWTREPNSAPPLTHTVARGPMTISLVVEGTAANRDMEIVKCEVAGKSTIKKLIPEGASVKKDQILVELDSSSWEDRQAQKELGVFNAEASFVQMREEIEIVKSQAESDISEAKLKYKFAQEDLTKYLEGEYPQELQQVEAQIKLAEAELERATEKFTWSEKLAQQGFLTRTELEADRLAQKKCELDLELAQGKMKLLKEYTHTRQVEQLRSDLTQAKMALERTERKSKSNIVKAQANLKAKKSAFDREKADLAKILDQISKCTIKAPVDADIVIYSTSGKRHQEPLQENTTVHEGQDLVFLPMSTSMKVDLKVPEANLRKIQLQMPVRLTADTLRGKTFFGQVAVIGLVPDAPNWWTGFRTVYSVEILLDREVPGLRAGTTCRAEIITEDFADVLSVPVQCVVRVENKPCVQVLRPDGTIEKKRNIQVGLDNNTDIHVISGLQAGEKVLMNPALSASSARDVKKPNRNSAGSSTPTPKKTPKTPTAKPGKSKPAGTPSKTPKKPSGGRSGKRRPPRR